MKNKKGILGNRMKKYESVAKTVLMKRTPVIIRIDGKAFHTFTRGFDKPFDSVLIKAMQDTLCYLCENIQGCVFGYTQSDEITLVLCDYQKITTSAWFDYEVQKLCSVSASMATMAFNKAFKYHAREFAIDVYKEYSLEIPEDVRKRIETYENACKRGAMFDSRCFNIPVNEVTNCILWRQQDATRNSIQSLGQHYFSHTELDKKSCNMIQDMLHEQKGVNWNDLPTYLKRGTACYVHGITQLNEETQVFETETKWILDLDMPILTGDDREYVEQLIRF